jgi:hypothetical protein
MAMANTAKEKEDMDGNGRTNFQDQPLNDCL